MDAGSLANGLPSPPAPAVPPRKAPMPRQVRVLDGSDLPEITRIHMVAFPGSLLTALGADAVRRLYDWQLRGPHEVVALGVVIGGQVAGFCFGGIFRGAVSGFVRTNRWFLGRRMLARPGLLLRRDTRVWLMRLLRSGQSLRAPAPATAVRSFGILAIAVDPTFQGSGIGRLLLEELEQLARRAGFAGLHLTVHPDNEPAVRLYERAGWRRVPGASGWAGTMAKDLGNA